MLPRNEGGKIRLSALFSPSLLEGYEAKICPTSSIANAIICSCINGEVCECLRQMGCEVEVFISANLDGGYEKNEEYFKKYTRLF